MPPPPEVLMFEIMALVISYVKKFMYLQFSTRPTCSLATPILVPWVQALYISVVDRSAIFENEISENTGRPEVRSVFEASICSGIEALCEYDSTITLSA